MAETLPETSFNLPDVGPSGQPGGNLGAQDEDGVVRFTVDGKRFMFNENEVADAAQMAKSLAGPEVGDDEHAKLTMKILFAGVEAFRKALQNSMNLLM